MLRIFVLILSIIFINACSDLPERSLPYWKESNSGMEFVLIPKGSFLMGNHEGKNDVLLKETLHEVTISKDFWLARTEVTQEQWHRIMGNEEIHPEKPSPFRNLNPQYPVVSVSYFDVQRFLKKLNELSNLNHFRLPTEAEWEYACRAGTITHFSFGTHIYDSLANFNAEISSTYSSPGKYIDHPLPVGSYPPNQLGLYDMHGNAWEWVADWYAPYSTVQDTNPEGPPDGNLKVIRGGSWYFGADNARSYSRRTHEPDLWGFSIGFRIVCVKNE